MSDDLKAKAQEFENKAKDLGGAITHTADEVKIATTALASGIQAIADALNKISPKGGTVGVDKEWLRATYALVGAYDNHYSTVRTTVSTFLVTVGLGIGAFFLKQNGVAKSPLVEEALALATVLPGVIFLIAMMLNLHFQRLTWCCWEIQKDIEKRLEDNNGFNAKGFRDALEEKFPESQPRFDGPGWFLLVAIFVYFGVLVTFYANKPMSIGIKPMFAVVVINIIAAWAIVIFWDWGRKHLNTLRIKILRSIADETNKKKWRRQLNKLWMLVVIILVVVWLILCYSYIEPFLLQNLKDSGWV